MNRNTDRLMQLTNQLLDFRKIEMKGVELQLNFINVTELARDNFTRFSDLAKQKQLQIFSFKSTEDISAYADEEALKKILNNLMDNAVKYADKIVRVKVEYADDRSFYKIIFENDGIIISPEKEELIFKSFYRMKENHNYPGTGIGLTLSKSLAEVHGGNLTMEYNGGQTNKFVLTLPIQPQIEKK